MLWVKVALPVAVLAGALTAKPVRADVLQISPIRQETPVWCWLAVGEMIFRHYGIANVNPAGVYQCGIAGAFFGGPCYGNCRRCEVGSGPVRVIRDMLVKYPVFVAKTVSPSSPALSAAVVLRALKKSEIKDEIDSGRPVVAGISPDSKILPPGLSRHAVLVVGYVDEDSHFDLLVNDPFPYRAVGVPSPYGIDGISEMEPLRYRIRYEVMVDKLNWRNSVSAITSTSSQVAGSPESRINHSASAPKLPQDSNEPGARAGSAGRFPPGAVLPSVKRLLKSAETTFRDIKKRSLGDERSETDVTVRGFDRCWHWKYGDRRVIRCETFTELSSLAAKAHFDELVSIARQAAPNWLEEPQLGRWKGVGTGDEVTDRKFFLDAAEWTTAVGVFAVRSSGDDSFCGVAIEIIRKVPPS